MLHMLQRLTVCCSSCAQCGFVHGSGCGKRNLKIGAGFRDLGEVLEEGFDL